MVQRHDYRKETKDVITKILSKVKDKSGTSNDAKELLGSLAACEATDDFIESRVVGFYIKVIDTVGKHHLSTMRYCIEGLTRLVEAGLIHPGVQLDAPGTAAGCGKSLDEALIESVTRHATKNRDIQLHTIKILELLVTSSYSGKQDPTTSTILQVVYQHLFRSFLGSQFLDVRWEAKGAFQRCVLSLLNYIEDNSVVIRGEAAVVTLYAAVAIIAASQLLNVIKEPPLVSDDDYGLGEKHDTLPQGQFPIMSPKGDTALHIPPRHLVNIRPLVPPAAVETTNTAASQEKVQSVVTNSVQESPLDAAVAQMGLLFSPPVGSCAAPVASAAPFAIPTIDTPIETPLVPGDSQFTTGSVSPVDLGIAAAADSQQSISLAPVESPLSPVEQTLPCNATVQEDQCSPLTVPIDEKKVTTPMEESLAGDTTTTAAEIKQTTDAPLETIPTDGQKSAISTTTTPAEQSLSVATVADSETSAKTVPNTTVSVDRQQTAVATTPAEQSLTDGAAQVSATTPMDHPLPVDGQQSVISTTTTPVSLPVATVPEASDSTPLELPLPNAAVLTESSIASLSPVDQPLSGLAGMTETTAAILKANQTIQKEEHETEELVPTEESEPQKVKVVTEGELLQQLLTRSVCEHDLFRVISTLCNQAQRDISKETESNSIHVNTRVYALQSLVEIFNSADEGTTASGPLINVLKSRLTSVLVTNIATTKPLVLFTEAVQLLQVLYKKCFRSMRSELTSIMIYLILPIARSILGSFEQLICILNFLSQLLSSPRQLVHIFANVDCCLDSDDLIKSIALTLSFIATRCYARYEWVTMQQAHLIQHKCCICICHLINSCIQWATTGTDQRSRILLASENPSAEFFRSRINLKNKEVELHSMWFEKNKKARELIIECGLTRRDPDSFARWLKRDALRLYLNPRGTAKILASRDEWCIGVLNSYIRSMDFEDLSLFEATFKFFSYFHPEGESAVLCRIGIYFAARYGMCNRHLITVDSTQHDLKKGQCLCLVEPGLMIPTLYIVSEDSLRNEPFVFVQICSEETLIALTPHEVVNRVHKNNVLSLDPTYITLMTILQASSEIHIKKNQKRTIKEWIILVRTATGGLMSEDAIEMVFSAILKKSITPEVNANQLSSFRFTTPLASDLYLKNIELLANVEQQIQEDQHTHNFQLNAISNDPNMRKPTHKQLRLANDQYRRKTKEYLTTKPEWKALDEQVELLGHKTLKESDLPIEKAMAKAYVKIQVHHVYCKRLLKERGNHDSSKKKKKKKKKKNRFELGIGTLKNNIHKVSQAGLLTSKYYPELTSRELSVVVFEVCIASCVEYFII